MKSSSRRDRFELAGLVLVVVLAGGLFFWNACPAGNRWLTRAPDGYYPLQSEGFRRGHLYVAHQPQPGLLALADPYDSVANAPYRTHDMSLWKGKYYLYFGVTPAAIFFLPVTILTGWHAGEALAVAVFAWGGLIAGAALLRAVRKSYYPDAPAWVTVAGTACLSIANPVAVLTTTPQVYQVPIACAYFLHMLTLACVHLAFRSAARRGFWLAAAGALFGLTLGARPNYIVGVCWLFFALRWCIRRENQPTFFNRRSLLLAAWTFLPALIVGAGLLAYNWLRFGSPLEFGMRYQLTGSNLINHRPLALGNLIPNGLAYLFGRGVWQIYFPFFIPPNGPPWGVVSHLPWVWLAPLAFLRRADLASRVGEARVFAGVVAVAAAANFLLMACFFFPTDRYACDFAPSLILLGSMGALAFAEKTVVFPRWLRARGLSAVAAAVSIFVGLAVFIQRLPTQEKLLSVARFFNWPAYAVQRTLGWEPGGLRLELELPLKAEGTAEPLVETGRLSNERDWVQIAYLPAQRARIDFFHAGFGLISGDEFSVPTDRRLVVELRFGGLLPPYAHPLFTGWTKDAFDLEQQQLWVRVNGTEVLRTTLQCYEAGAQDVRLGQLEWASGISRDRFSGKILHSERLSFAREALPRAAVKECAPVELTFFFPAGRTAGAEPLLATGQGRRSDLLYCIYDGPGRLRLAVDHFGNGGPQSAPAVFDPLKPHVLAVWMGSFGKPVGVEKATAAPWEQRLVAVLDGRPMLNLEFGFYPSSPGEAAVGFNANGSSVAARQFSGRITALKTVAFETLPAPAAQRDYGAVTVEIMFPSGALGTVEPLVVTGVAGAGDLLTVRYLDRRHVSFGFDHWGGNGIQGEPVEIDYARPHHIEATMGSLYPLEVPADLRTLVRVRLDGKTVLAGNSPCHPTDRARIWVGENPIGGSTSGPSFSGRVLSVRQSLQPAN